MYEAPPCESQAWKVAPAKRPEDMDGTYLDHATARRCSEPFTLLPAKFLSKLSLGPGTDAGNGEEMPQGLACGKGLDRTWAKLPPAPASCRVSLSSSFPRPLPTPAGPAAPRASSKAPAWPRGSRSLAEDPGLQDQAWYAGSCDRHVAESVLQGVNKDSAFMVRQSSGLGWNQPFTLVVLYKGRVYNIPIRYLESSRQYTLGKDGKSREERFDSVASIVQHYSEYPLVLIEGSSASRAHTCLLFPVKP
ncbi:SH2 domain-containing protein 6 [Dermochelys coriacea]|uniref:SH2 domain-containing protein 6 n=1 Tax=Dermochelys coriacea TaxID=27794 RepID=UPI0018E869C5|nr:SH2 domain-containing protein 6 [Dermochelys coriacea]